MIGSPWQPMTTAPADRRIDLRAKKWVAGHERMRVQIFTGCKWSRGGTVRQPSPRWRRLPTGWIPTEWRETEPDSDAWGSAMLTHTDRVWFTANPSRLYRNRPIPNAEAARWRKPPRADRYAWVIIRRSDGAIRRYTLPAYTALDDTDAELGWVFDQLRDSDECEPRIFPPSPGGSLARIESSLSNLLAASSPFGPDEHPAVAYRDQMRTRGCEALAIGGPETLTYLARRLAETAPDRAEVHAAILQVAWAGLTEARL